MYLNHLIYWIVANFKLYDAFFQFIFVKHLSKSVHSAQCCRKDGWTSATVNTIIYNACLLKASWQFFFHFKKNEISHIWMFWQEIPHKYYFSTTSKSPTLNENYELTQCLLKIIFKKANFYVCTVFSPWNTKLKKAGFLWSHCMMRTVGTCLKKV